MSETDILAYPILLVDDDPEGIALFESTFPDLFNLRTTTSPFEALEILGREPIALLLTDYRMPGMDGIDLCERVKQRWPRVLRAMLTGFADRDVVIDAINRGEIHRMLTRPAKAHDLRQMLVDLLSRAHLEHTVDALRAAMVQRERDAYVALARGGILHDLAGVTGGLTLSCHLLKEQIEQIATLLPAPTVHELREELEAMDMCIDHIADLHHQARQISRASTGRRERHDIRELVETAVEMVRCEPGADVSYEFVCPEPHAVHVDRVDVSRILLNLLRNARAALKSTPDPRVRIEVSRVGLDVAVSVADNGPGIPAHQAHRVFELAWSTKVDEGGQGLGLYLCRALAQANGGHLTLQRAPLGGAEFILTVPSRTKAELGLLSDQPTPLATVEDTSES